MDSFVRDEASVKVVELAREMANVNVTKDLVARPVINVLKDISQQTAIAAVMFKIAGLAISLVLTGAQGRVQLNVWLARRATCWTRNKAVTTLTNVLKQVQAAASQTQCLKIIQKVSSFAEVDPFNS